MTLSHKIRSTAEGGTTERPVTCGRRLHTALLHTRASQPNTGMEAQLPEYRNSVLACRPRCRTRGSSDARSTSTAKLVVTKTPPQPSTRMRGETPPGTSATQLLVVKCSGQQTGWVGWVTKRTETEARSELRIHGTCAQREVRSEVLMG